MPARTTMEVIGFAAAATTSALGLSSSLAQVQQATAGPGNGAPDWITLQLVFAISSLVGALVFVHRLLMKSKGDELALANTGFERSVGDLKASSATTLNELKGAMLATISAKDEFIRHQSTQLEQARLEAAELRAEKEQLVVRLLTGDHGPMAGRS